MLHTSTEQPYPSTQHESGVQPQYQLWEQPRYEPRSGLSSTRWVHVGAGSQSRVPCPAPNACPTQCEAEWPAVLPLLSLWSFLLSFLLPSYPLLPPLHAWILAVSSFYIWEEKNTTSLCTVAICDHLPASRLADRQARLVVTSNLRGRSAKVNCFLTVELIQNLSSVIEFRQFVFNFTKGQDTRDSVQRRKKIKIMRMSRKWNVLSLGLIILI